MRKHFAERLRSYQEDPEFLVEKLVIDLNEQFCQLMDQKNLSRSELARLLKVSPPWITKVLNGNPNLTLLSLVKIATALECEVSISIRPRYTQAMADIQRSYAKAATPVPVDGERYRLPIAA